jgi:DNA-binding transcriptional ArsR family regulator
MKLKLGYYPILDTVLALRQLYCRERFKPFVSPLENIYNRISDGDKEFIDDFGDNTSGWLDIIEKLIHITLYDTVSVEELILKIHRNPEILMNIDTLNECIHKITENISNLWKDYFSSEIAKNNKIIYNKVMEISQEIDTYDLIPYLLRISDRIEKKDDETLKFFIKPEHQITINEITNIIIMPSIFASRNLTFWYNGTDYLFYISINSFNQQTIEPSDMLMLKTLAFNDRTRLKILRILSSGNYSTADMAEKLSVNSSTISRHFKVFKDAGYVDIFAQEGNSIYYSLNTNEIQKSFDMILKYIMNEEDI